MMPTPPTHAPLTIDLFCRVIDNFGDIGVCWRFARQLARGRDGDQGCGVRLYVDDFKTFARIEPRLDPDAIRQTIDGVAILRWTAEAIGQFYNTPDLPMADAVIEAFACDLPQAVIAAMKATTPNPVWVDLEYLSAEDWVDGVHAIPSTNPMTGMKKTLFFPGFTPRTGGLSREAGLMDDIKTFQSDTAAQNTWRARHGIPAIDPTIIDISLFCYDNAPVTALMGVIDRAGIKTRFLAPAGVAPTHMAALKDFQSDHVTIHTVPFLTQDDYDKLLWTSHVNFVRGEDSFVRAIWAGRPMVWQIYVQEENAHLIKLGAFLSRYGANLAPEDAEKLAQFTIMWNVEALEEGSTRVMRDFFEALPRLGPHARDWASTLAEQADLADQLVRFIRNQKDQN
ncbi:elongation factor P maturation arginine rhamnosyltransferase EarP [Micavibrio aeruginosavorus]|uniref:elongation factor P maturation arginine rhamnosyltransferase EarP n=1 Tax=Micavibrio aeruginosavorus TaxID=349221 RepID=UPI003F4AAEC7